jgi:putative FmdB family regulatory protein
MPTYVYECAKCGDEFELYQSFSEDPLKKHPGCGGKVAKVFQPVGIVLKGSGFYKNDSRNGGKRGKGSETSSEKSDGASDSGKSDSGKSDGKKSDSAKSDGGRSDGGSGDSGSKSTSTATKSDPKPSTAAAKST